MIEPTRNVTKESQRRAAGCLHLAAAAAVVAGALYVDSGAAQVPTSRIRGIDVYRTSQLDARELVEQHESAIFDFVAAIDANDEETLDRLYPEIVESIRARGDFAFVELGITTTFADGENLIDVSIELVDTADAAVRLSFDPEPKGAFPDPGGVLAAWDEYQSTGFELVQTRQIAPSTGECPAHHCVWSFTHPALAPFLPRFDQAAREHHDTLVQVLREDADAGKRAKAAFVLAHVEDARQLVLDLVPSLDDPASGVRNNVMRVLMMVAQQDDTVEIPFAPLARRVDDPSTSCRNKAAYLIAALADRPEYREEILAITPALLRLLRLQKPNNHDPAYEILRTISGADFGERDYERWEAWVEEARPEA